MPTYYRNAENALRRANEFCELGKDDEALECLYGVLKNRKNRMIKQIHESIINKYLELCTELKKSQMAKDGLYCYRFICQHVNVKSWEDSISKYLELAESKVENAQKAFQSIILDIDDLDQDMTPEILLKTVSNEDAQDRTERIILLPWIKFLWECYRNCLDLLRNNTQANNLYHSIAQNAFKFCVKFSRRNELRKLCNILKMNSMYIQKRQTNIKANDFEIYVAHLDTRFVELESAINMELWQDAFKAIENIHCIINISKKLKNSRVMAHYYDKISCVLWKGQEYLFHAVAVLCYFQLVKDQKKNISTHDITKLACRVLLSIMAIPLDPVYPTIDLVAETDITIIEKKNILFSSLMDLYKCPTRASLLKNITQLGITQYLPKEFQDLFQVIECDIQVTEIRFCISRVTKYIENWSYCGLEQYMPLLHKVAIVKMLPIVFNMYINIKMSKLLHLTGLSDMSELEFILVDAARRYEFPIRIDHRNMCVHFPPDFNIFKKETSWNDELLVTNSFPDTRLKFLVHLQCAMKRAVELINPEREVSSNKLIAEKIAARYLKTKDIYRKNLLNRKTIIESYKETMENLRIRKDEEEKKRLADQLLEFEAAERERLLRETEERNLQRQKQEQEKIKRKIMLEKVETFKKTALGGQVIQNLELDKLENLDPQIVFSKQIEELNRERKEFSSKLKRQDRHFNHMERAKRIEETPLLIEQYEANKKIDKGTWKNYQRNKLETAYKNRERDLWKKKRMLTIKEDLENFLKQIRKRKLSNYNQEIATFVKTLKEEKQKRLKERAEDRKRERKMEWIKQQEFNKNKTRKEISTVDDGKTKNKHSKIKESIKNPNAKSKPSPEKQTRKKWQELISDFVEESRSIGKVVSCSIDAGREQYFENENLYYCNRMYKQDSAGIKPTEMPGQRFSCSQFQYESAKTENYRSDSYSKSNTKVTSIVFERSEKSDFSWKTPSSKYACSRNSHYANQNHRLSRDNADSQPTITIMQRRDSTKPSIDLESKMFTPEFQIRGKTQERTSGNEHSRTPWAKLKRKELE